jgi:hypothetical protein
MFLIPIQSNLDTVVGARGALAAAGLAALVGFLYLKKDDKGMN